jgi:hypothetical protein
MHDPRVHKAIQEDREVRRLRARAWLLFRRFHRLRLPWEAWPEHGGGRGGMKLARVRRGRERSSVVVRHKRGADASVASLSCAGASRQWRRECFDPG